MIESQVLHAAERVLESFEDRLFMTADALRSVVDGDEVLLDRCLTFLHERDRILVAAQPPTLFHRTNLNAAVLREVGRSGPLTADVLARTLDVPVPIACEVLGWLERDGSIESVHRGDDVSFRTV